MTDKKSSLLILEDDDGLRRQYKWAFPEYDLVLTASREEAVAAFRRLVPPVALIDLGLPPDPDGVSEGLAALSEMREIAPESKIIVATGNEAREAASIRSPSMSTCCGSS
jgi:two-component system, NtrC family, response regulator